jgi:hypothetical protein
MAGLRFFYGLSHPQITPEQLGDDRLARTVALQGISFQTEIASSKSSSIVDGARPDTRLLMTAHKFLIGLRLGDLLGQSGSILQNILTDSERVAFA